MKCEEHPIEQEPVEKPVVTPPPAPRMEFTTEMLQQQHIHELCTHILDIGLREPYVLIC